MTERELIIAAALERYPSEIGTPSHIKVPYGYNHGRSWLDMYASPIGCAG